MRTRLTMVPFADIFNHRSPPDLDWSWKEEGEKQGFFMHAIKNVDKGSQVYDTYGMRSNEDLLLFYGFY